MDTSSPASAGLCPYWFSSFSLCGTNLGVQEYRKLDLPGRSADVIQAISRSEKQLGSLLPGLPRLVRFRQVVEHVRAGVGHRDVLYEEAA